MDTLRKTHRVLTIILICFLLIFFRSWYLCVIQHQYHFEQAQKPQRRLVVEKAERGTIHDRFDIPLAINKIQYNASVMYADIRQIPIKVWKTDPKGKRTCVFARQNYIKELAEMLSYELALDTRTIYDIINGKAALFPHTPFVIKEGISEEQYYRLRIKEKEWVGLQAEKVARRYYPFGKVGCGVIGYLGSIDPSYYNKVAEELHVLETYLHLKRNNENPFLPEGFHSSEQVYKRYLELEEKSYTMNDFVGKAGIEAFYEESLRGSYGKHIYEINTKGDFIKKLEGSKNSVSGKKITLTLSAELQEFAEQLLEAAEGPLDSSYNRIDEKWIRGGAVVALLPKTGEIVALASSPRYNPNDFIPSQDFAIRQEKEQAIRKWLEDETYIASIWDGKRPLEREYYSFLEKRPIIDKIYLSLPIFLNTIIADDSPIKKIILPEDPLLKAFEIQKQGIDHSALVSLIETDRLLVLDLYHLLAPNELFSEDLVDALKNLSLEEYFQDRQQVFKDISLIKKEIEHIYHATDFEEWRSAFFKTYLKEKRLQEKERKTYSRPYVDYLDQAKAKLFSVFWNTYKDSFLYTLLTGKIPFLIEDYPPLNPYFAFLQEKHRLNYQKQDLKIKHRLDGLTIPLGLSYLKTFRPFEELTTPLRGKYPYLRSQDGTQTEKHLASAFYPACGYSFLRPLAFRQLSAQGSVFKLITAYQLLMERYNQNLPLNPLIIIDDLQGGKTSFSPKQILGFYLDGTPIYRQYKGGTLPRSSHSGIGEIDLIKAIERSSNVYFALVASDYIQNPSNLAQAAKLFGFGRKTGIDLPGECLGHVPNDLEHNLSGLYAFSIGQHTLTVSPLQTAVMLSVFANQGVVIQPHVLKKIETPYSSSSQQTLQNSFQPYSNPVVVDSIPLPSPVSSILLTGMRQAVIGSKGSCRPAIMRPTYDHPTAIKEYDQIHQDLLAKTGTAELHYKQDLSRLSKPTIKNHIWFASIAYPRHTLLEASVFEDPELIVVVFLKFRKAGREGGPIAAQVIHKWREIQEKHRPKF